MKKYISFFVLSAFFASPLTSLAIIGEPTSFIEPTPFNRLPSRWVQVISPNGGENFSNGDNINFRWRTSRYFSEVNIIIHDSTNFYVVGSNLSNTGSYNLVVPQNIPAGSYVARISNFNGKIYDESDNTFRIDNPVSDQLIISVSSAVPDGNIISGSISSLYASYILDATRASDDIIISHLPLLFDTTSSRTNLTNCKLYDGAIPVNTGANIKNPFPGEDPNATVINFDAPGLRIYKGLSKTINLRCDLERNAPVGSQYWWGLDASQATFFTGATYVGSGAVVNETMNGAHGATKTAIDHGSYKVTNSALPLQSVHPGDLNVTLAVFNFEAYEEQVDIKQVALELGNTASNSPSDLANQEVTLWDGSGNQLGRATFFTDFALPTLTRSFVLTPGTPRQMYIKGDISTFANIGDHLVVNYDGDKNGNPIGNYGIGLMSGSNVAGTSPDTNTTGVNIVP